MPSTVYKGDLTEISFGHETGLQLDHGFAGTFLFRAKNNGRDLKADTSVITFDSGAASQVVNGGQLKYPVGMLVGAKVSFRIASSNPNFSTDDDATVSGRTFTVVQHTVTSGDVTELTITPALTTDHSAAEKDSKTDDIMFIHGFTVPSVDVSMAADGDSAPGSSESVLTDQFLGLAATVTLPETKVDLKRYHVVGLGRDVAVQVPGRFINEGGSFEVNMHNPRWLYYCLGMEAVDVSNIASLDSLLVSNDYTVNADPAGIEVGATVIPFTGTGTPSFTGPSAVAAGDYVIVVDETRADVITYNEADSADGTEFGAVTNPEVTYFDKTETNEIRRIVAITSTHIFLDDALLYPHAHDTVLRFVRPAADNATGSPNRESTGNIQNPITRLLYSRSSVPSFAMEVSIRRRDSDGNEDDVVDGGPSDTKQLTRVFRGCKVKDFSLTADTDAALRLNVNFDSALCYTDTGRLEGTPGDRFNPHRMFEDTANSDANRKTSGIAKGTQKPYMFYNGTIDLAGVRVGQVVSFTLNGSTGVQQFYTINGSPIADSATDQVPHAGSRNASIAVEGKTEYMMDMEIIVDDPVFYHHMRRAVDFNASTDNMIRLSFTKAGSGATRERIDILLDDYVITEAPLPIPEDKGPIRAPLKVMPKAIRVVSTDTLFHC
jgi:hypothetical protein